MMKKRNKKAMGHVEMIISFVIFVSFVTFMFLVFKPLKTSEISYLDMTESKILEYISTDLEVFSIRVNDGLIGECFYFDYQLENPIIVKNELEIVMAKKTDKIYFDNQGLFYRIYSAEGLDERGLEEGCVELQDNEYKLGVKKTYKKIHYKKLENLQEKYNENYKLLKKEIGLKNDFNFIIKNLDEEVMFKGEKYKPEGVEVIAKTIPIEILDKDANLNPAIMNLQSW